MPVLVSLVSNVPNISVVMSTTFAKATMILIVLMGFIMFPMLILMLVSIIIIMIAIVFPDLILANPMGLPSTTLPSSVIIILIIRFVFTMITMLILVLMLVMRLLKSLLMLLHVPPFRLLLIFCSFKILGTSSATTESLFIFVRGPLTTLKLLVPLLTFSQIDLLDRSNRDQAKLLDSFFFRLQVIVGFDQCRSRDIACLYLHLRYLLSNHNILQLLDLVFESHVCTLQISNVLVLGLHATDLIIVQVREHHRVLKVLVHIFILWEEWLSSRTKSHILLIMSLILCIKVLLTLS